MESEWLVVKLGDFCTKVASGATPKGGSNVYQDQGEVSLIRSQNVYSDGFNSSGIVFIDDVAAHKLRNSSVQHNDVLLNITGDSVARVCLAPEKYLPARVNQHVAIIRPSETNFDSRFVRYFLASENSNKLLLNLASAGATRNALTKGMIENFEIVKPPLKEQFKISNILEGFDKKITLNREINQTLEQMAQALFKSWFVDFDPVIDNALDAGNPIPDALAERAARRQTARASDDFQALPDDVLQLFPNEFEDSELGWVPKGWSVKEFKELVEISSSKRIFSKEYQSEVGIPFYRGKEISELSKGLRVKSDIFISEERFKELQTKYGAPKEGDILITSVGTIGNTYLVEKSDRFYFKDGNLTWIKAYHDLFIPHYFIEWFKSSLGREIIESIKIGTTQQAITINSLNAIKIVRADSSVHKRFENYIRSIFLKTRLNNAENNNLEDIRDTLLPKLISGELRLDSLEVKKATSLLDTE